MNVIGFTRDSDSLMRIILTQPYVRCLRLATKDEIDALVNAKGFCDNWDGQGVILEKSGRYTEKSEHRIELLKGEGFYPSKSMKSMDDYVKHFQQDKPKKPNFDGIRQRIRDFEKDNELLF